MDTNIAKQLHFLVMQNTGIKLEKIIEQILESSLYNTNDILDNDNVKALNQPEGSNKYYNTLFLFTKHNHTQYIENKKIFINLNPIMMQKLKIITLLDIVKEKKNVEFYFLYKMLNITDPFEFDSIVFEAISLGLILGKIDQKGAILKVLYVRGRDHIQDITSVGDKVDKWIENIEKSSKYIETEINEIRSETQNFGMNIGNSVDRINNIINSRKNENIFDQFIN